MAGLGTERSAASSGTSLQEPLLAKEMSHNERLIMSLIRLNGATSKADIARMGGFSPQTASVLIRKLETAGLLQRGSPVKGRVGQPSVPMDLAPDGAFSAGLRIGRRSADVTVIDLRGDIHAQHVIRYAYPLPTEIIAFAEDGLAQCRKDMHRRDWDRLIGLGIAAPFQIYNWLDRVDAPVSEMDDWRETDLAAEVAAVAGLPVWLENDATCACRAEHLIGRGQSLTDYAYFFIGFFVGGGIVMDNRIRNGVQGNAGAFGPLPIPDKSGTGIELIDRASLYILEASLKASGRPSDVLWTNEAVWEDMEDLVEPWLKETAGALAWAIVSACSIIDFPAVVIDGAFPGDVRARLVSLINEALDRQVMRGLIRPAVVEGSAGFQARALGAASLPLFSRFYLENRLAA